GAAPVVPGSGLDRGVDRGAEGPLGQPHARLGGRRTVARRPVPARRTPDTHSLTCSLPQTVMLAACLAWIAWRRRDLLPLGAITVAGWALVNHQFLSGVQTQNNHWQMRIVGPTLTMIEVLIVLGWVKGLAGRPRQAAAWGLAVVAGVDLAVSVA